MKQPEYREGPEAANETKYAEISLRVLALAGRNMLLMLAVSLIVADATGNKGPGGRVGVVAFLFLPILAALFEGVSEHGE